MARIFLVEDDPSTIAVIEQGLKFHNHVVETSSEGEAGLEQLLRNHYDLAIIDWDLPKLPGIEICARYRSAGGEAAILFLTGKQLVSNKVQAFECGADDYLCKPFSYAELLARVKALLRRPPTVAAEQVAQGDIILNIDLATATYAGADLKLSPGEFALLEIFMRNPGRVFTAPELLERSFKSETDLEAVRVRIMRLRKKMSQAGSPERVVNVKGFGYKFE